MPQQLSPEARSLKRAYKTLKSFYRLLLDTEIMNDQQYRRDYQSALIVVKDNYLEKKKGS